jgi:serine-type D-Ala-D-Ala carboxypeptidase/endopeptidase (penicillin-binding protein 4)
MPQPALRPRAARATAALFVSAVLAASMLFVDAGELSAQTSKKRSTASRTTRKSTKRARVTPASRRAPPAPAWTSPRGPAALTSDLSNLVASRIRNGQFGVMVVSLTRGDTLFAQNAGEMMQPASTMKLFSTAVALDRFGPEHTFTTDVLRDGSVGGDGTVQGNIYLRADGDPSLSARFFRDPNLPMNTLAKNVAAAGIRRVTGDLIYDESIFDGQRIPDGWKTTYLGAA